MLLTLDIGNTQTVLGVFQGTTLKAMWRIATDKAATSDELRVKLLPLLAAEAIETDSIDGCAIASVVPTLTSSWEQAVSRVFGCTALICSTAIAAELFEADYDNPTEIGADRIADAVAAKEIYGAPVVVVDFGTATNIEVIAADGRFQGGIIAPGLETSAAALFSHATKLPTIDLHEPPSVIGKNTVHAMQAGIVFGEADRVDGFVRRIFDELGYKTPVVATGGLATTMAPLCSTVTAVNPELTLEGLRIIFEAAEL